MWKVTLRCQQGCTDAAPEEPHPHPTRCDAAMREGRRWPRIGAASGRVCHVVSFFFCRLAPMRLRLGPIRADLRRLGPYRPKSAKWLVQAETADSGRNSNTLSHSVTRLSSLCSLRCACARLPWITLRLSVSALCLGISTATQHKCYFPAWSSRLAWGFSKKKKKKNTNATLLARELQYKNLWLPQNALCFVFYWTP